MLTGNPESVRAGEAPDSMVGALRLLLDEVEEEAEFVARFEKPLRDLSIEELCAATDRGVFVGESWPRRPPSDQAPETEKPGAAEAQAAQPVNSHRTR